MIRIAIYDLDRTVTALPTWTPFLLHAARTIAPWRLALVPALLPPALARAAGRLDRDALKERMHRLLIGPSRPPAQLAAVAEAFAAQVAVRPGAAAQIARDSASGWRILLATAAHRFYAAPIAHRLGIDDVVATDAARDAAGYITHRLRGANCYGIHKHAAVARWLAAQGIDRAAARLRFYSDHVSDRPMFDWVDEPVAVNPHRPLARLAAARGWLVRDWAR